MADFTKTITNSINCFGPAPSNKWNAHDWNAFLWGEGNTDHIVNVGKVISNTLAMTDSLSAENGFFRTLNNTLTVTSDNSSEGLRDSDGYSYVFISNVTNAEQRTSASWTQGTRDTETWTSGTATSTAWS